MNASEQRMLEIARAGQETNQSTEPASPEVIPPDGSGTATPGSSSPAEPTPAEPTPYEYQHPMLKGRSPEEVERLFLMQEQASREAGARLTSIEKQMSEDRQTQQPAAQVATPEESARTFFEDPGKVIRRHLDETVAPLREEIREAKGYFQAQDARANLKGKYKDWDQVEPYIDYLLSQQNFPNPNDEGLLSTLYLTAKGAMIEQGINVQSSTATAPPAAASAAQPPQGAIPPQHAASTPPPPPPRAAAPGGGTVRPLTETEKRLAREYKMTPEQYIKFQEMDMDEVASADFDQQKKEGQ